MSEAMAFTVFCVEAYKNAKALTGKQVDALFRRYGLYDYLHESYDGLHTTGHQYIVKDIDAFIAVRNSDATTQPH